MMSTLPVRCGSAPWTPFIDQRAHLVYFKTTAAHAGDSPASMRREKSAVVRPSAPAAWRAAGAKTRLTEDALTHLKASPPQAEEGSKA